MDIFGNKDDQKKKIKLDKNESLDFRINPERPEGLPDLEDVENYKTTKYQILAVVLFFVIILKLFFSQIVFGKLSDNLAKGNKIRPRVVTAMRGVVYDSKGNWLSRNVPSFDLALYPSDLPKNKEERSVVYQKIAELTGASAEEIKGKAEENGLLFLDSITLKENLSNEEALLFEEKTASIPGVLVFKRASREYKNIGGLSHILGYTGRISEEEYKNETGYRLSDWIGKTGLEYSYEKDLKGRDGIEQIEVDSKGNVVRILADENNREPIPGNNLKLYLDADLQERSALALENGIKAANKSLESDNQVTSGVVIAMNPQTGGILSMVSLPSYDNNEFAKGISNSEYSKLSNDSSKPMFNRAISGTYPPGSTIKIMMAVAGLSEGTITRQTSFDTPAEIKIESWSYPDWKDHGITNVVRAIAESNNVFFYSVGGGYEQIQGLGIDLMKKWWEKFGLGEETGIDLNSEASGLLPDSDWKEEIRGEPWYIGDTYLNSIGQGDLLVTPIQMVRMVSAIANGGKLLNPQIVQSITNSEGEVVKKFSTRVENQRVASEEVIKTVQEGMRMTITEGSARTLNDLPFAVAGKTGTAQFFNNQKTHAWFECYAPYENPEIAIVVVVEGGGGGHEVAVPVAKEILQYYFSKK